LKHRLLWWQGEDRTPVVLLHGYMDSADTWQFLVDALPQDWTLAAPDWRGFGHSEWAPGGYWFPDYLADLEALLALLCPESPAGVIGHSMGANVAALYAGIREQRLQWLINLEGVGLQPTQPQEAPARYAQWLDEVRAGAPASVAVAAGGTPTRTEAATGTGTASGNYRSVEQLAQLLMRRNPRLPAERAGFLARAWTCPDEHSGGVRLVFDPRHRWVNPVLYRREEAEACWLRMRCPMLLLTGSLSAHRERRERYFGDELLRTAFDAARAVSLPGVGHMMHHEDPAAVAQAIVSFVGAPPARRSAHP
ncbi:MAG: alpha/beta hydrolase, partial [Sinobacteraceae bacterium]|nr:alpha/beta hydrolase [Nevskiaceae bacterium]